ncbi:MAG: hypothetical protein Edafosvirus26_11 [Edafosvirus sp.]|uniref:Ankyrin repeat protein n=1 Tax=Edafosvirus sp. TaxID=2487765 RepID=A0A3G4ZZA3_9VIRU|nr:MAG: hypothetical protein Edafosvirus26_11 [Edafosvirus sp.]
MNRIIDLMDDNNFLTCVKEDIVEEFKKKYPNLNELKNRFINGNQKILLPLGAILFNNAFKIAYHVAKLEGITYEDYLILIAKYKSSKDKSKKNAIIKFILDTYIFHKLESEKVGHLINMFASMQCWNVIDFFHYHGFKAINVNEFMKHVPAYKLNEMNKLGYNTENSAFLIKMIKNLNVSSKEIQKYQNIAGCEKYLFQYRDSALIDYYVINNKIKLTQKELTYACNHLNFDAIQYLLTKGIELTEKNLKSLLKYNNGIIGHYERRRFRRRFRRTVFVKEPNHKKIINFEENFVNIIKNNNNILTLMKNTSDLWFAILKNNYLLIANYLIENGFKIKLSKIDSLLNIKKNIMKDDVENIKKLFELKIIKPIDISENSLYLDMAVINGANKIVDYFYNTLKMKCSKNIITMRYYFGNHDFDNCIKNLIKINYPFYDVIFKLACYSGNLEAVKLLHTKVTVTSKHIELALVNYQTKIVDFLIENKCTYTKRNMIDRLLDLCVYYRKTKQVMKIIKYANDKLEGTATSRCIRVIINNYDKKVLEYLNNNFNMTINQNISIYNLMHIRYGIRGRRYLRRHPRNIIHNTKNFNTIQYLHENMKMKIYNHKDEADRIIKQLLLDDNFILLRYIGDKINYKFKTTDLKYAMDNFCQIDIIQYLESKGLHPTEIMFSNALFDGSLHIVKYFHEKYKYTIDLKQLHIYLCHDDPRTKILWYIINVLGIKPTPYSIDILLRKARCYCTLYGLLEILLKNVNGITEYAKNKMSEIDAHRDHAWSSKILNKVKTIQYEPHNDEILNDNDVADVLLNHAMDWEDFVIGEVHQEHNNNVERREIDLEDIIVENDEDDDENETEVIENEEDINSEIENEELNDDHKIKK